MLNTMLTKAICQIWTKAIYHLILLTKAILPSIDKDYLPNFDKG